MALQCMDACGLSAAARPPEQLLGDLVAAKNALTPAALVGIVHGIVDSPAGNCKVHAAHLRGENVQRELAIPHRLGGVVDDKGAPLTAKAAQNKLVVRFTEPLLGRLGGRESTVLGREDQVRPATPSSAASHCPQLAR